LQQWLAALALVPDLQAVPWTLLCRSLVSPAQTTAMRHGRHGGRTHRTPPMSPSEPDRLDTSHRARTLLQHAAARRPRQNQALPLPRPTHTVYWPPLDLAGAPSPAYKKPPFFPEKNHTIPSTSLDNVSLSPVPCVELADLDRSAEHRAFPAVLSFPRCCACWRWRRRAPAATLHPRRRSPSPPVSSPCAALLPDLSPVPSP
jgi:hypothetical protein